MTKHEDICNAYKISHEKFCNYDFECTKIAKGTRLKFIKYLGCNPNDIKLTLNDPQLVDSHFRFHIKIKIYIAGPNSYPQQLINLYICLRKIKDEWKIKLEDDEIYFRVADNLDGIELFFDSVFKLIIDSYENSLEYHLTETKTTGSIGFELLNK